VSDSTDTILARQLHQAALDVVAARERGDVTGEQTARARLESLSSAYRAAGHTSDELEAAKANGMFGGLLGSAATLVRNVAIAAALVIGFLLWLQYRRRES
jgi:hypothetical protein